ncbi:hypothetical protein OHB11_37295 [Streptomyces zaomyceticus]|uniref:Uncharacterized protein n=1 Tax=Streptomyces zaomyceticus TaxID=68286 RepID=A0ABZ1LMX5_9ACTN
MREPRPPKRSDAPIPHDREDQQATAGEDPLAVPVPGNGLDDSDGSRRTDGTRRRTEDGGARRGPRDADDTGRRDADLPDTDEAGSGPEGGPRHGPIHPEHPVPDEPTG